MAVIDLEHYRLPGASNSFEMRPLDEAASREWMSINHFPGATVGELGALQLCQSTEIKPVLPDADHQTSISAA